jgi:DNA-binding protein HU-beta
MGKNLTKAELISAAAKDTGLTKMATERVFGAILKTIQDGLVNGQRITLVGFGTFSVGDRQARKGRNPRTRQEITIPAAKVARFKPGKALRNAVNQ